MFRSAIRKPRNAAPVSLTPRQVGTASNYPFHVDGTGYVGGIIELGGGYKLSQVKKAFTAAGLPCPTFVDVPVGSGSNSPDGPDGADGEVQLDMEVAGSIAPAMTIRTYFADNSDASFLAALQQAVEECHGVSISWGGPEDQWDAKVQQEFEAVIKAARADGVPVFVAAGDSGSRDGEGHAVVDFPASSPSAIGCGGTRLELNADGSRATETVWDDSDTQSATGGGVSKRFPGRQVPDIAANADPDTGYEVVVDGRAMVVGGTSAVAPLYLGLHALLWQINGGKPFDFLNLVVSNPTVCFDVTSGDNGDYRAGIGRDDTTGFGVVDGGRVADLLEGNSTPTPVPVPVPAPTPPPVPDGSPLADFPVKTVQAWISHTHAHTQRESLAARSLTAWAAEYGVTL